MEESQKKSIEVGLLGQKTRIRHEDEGLLVQAEGTLPREKAEGLQSRMDLFRGELEKKAGIPVTLEIEARQVDLLVIRSVPDRDSVR